jgi:hypothetical protein
MERKSSVSTELTGMVDRNIRGFITYESITSRELRQGIGARMTKMMMPERCGGGSSSKGVVCGCLRRARGRKTDGVQWPEAITPSDHVSGSKILHRWAKRIKFH